MHKHKDRLLKTSRLIDIIDFSAATESEKAELDQLLNEKGNQILERSKPFTRFMLGKIATSALRNRAFREIRSDLDNERREALGYKGRIIEDGIGAALALYTRTPLRNKAKAAERGEYSPVTDEAVDGFWSMYASADDYPELKTYLSENQGTDIEDFRFAVAADESHDIVTHPDYEHADLYLVASIEHGYKRPIRVDEGLFEQIGNRRGVISDFEKLAENLRDRSETEAYLRHLDRHV